LNGNSGKFALNKKIILSNILDKKKGGSPSLSKWTNIVTGQRKPKSASMPILSLHRSDKDVWLWPSCVRWLSQAKAKKNWGQTTFIFD